MSNPIPTHHFGEVPTTGIKPTGAVFENAHLQAPTLEQKLVAAARTLCALRNLDADRLVLDPLYAGIDFGVGRKAKQIKTWELMYREVKAYHEVRVALYSVGLT